MKTPELKPRQSDNQKSVIYVREVSLKILIKDTGRDYYIKLGSLIYGLKGLKILENSQN